MICTSGFTGVWNKYWNDGSWGALQNKAKCVRRDSCYYHWENDGLAIDGVCTLRQYCKSNTCELPGDYYITCSVCRTGYCDGKDVICD